MQRVAGLMFAAVALAGSVQGCAQSAKLNYVYAVEIETPAGLMRRQTTRQIEVSGASPFMQGTRYHRRGSGEAVLFALPGGVKLFALLRGADGNVSYPTYIFDCAFPQSTQKGDVDPYRKFQRINRERPIAEIWPKTPQRRSLTAVSVLPMMVVMRRDGDLDSLAVVDPENMSKELGAGYSLRRVSVQVTDRPVSHELRASLSWLPADLGLSLKPPRGLRDQTLPATLMGLDFVRPRI